MAAQRTKINKSLQAGIDAIKKGNRVWGREVLLEVVQHDADLEEAWWWLSQVVVEPREQMRALEHVVRLNPHHPEAAQQLTALRQRHLSRPPEARWADLLPRVPLEENDGVDDPYQCLYCGSATAIDDAQCPHCGGKLRWRLSRSTGSPTLRRVVLLLGLSLALGLLLAVGPLFALSVAQGGADPAPFQLMLRVPLVPLVLGNFLALPAEMATRLLVVYGARAALLLALMVGLRERWVTAYYGTMAALAADLLLSLYLLVAGYASPAGALLNLALTLAAGLALFGSSYEFAVNDERVLVKPDGRARSAVDFYRLGLEYERRGMWALAVAQWRKAVGLAPAVTRYYTVLGLGYAQLRRFERSLRALEEAQRQAPDDPEIARLIAHVRTRAEKHALLRR